jgi:hypothetical protein
LIVALGVICDQRKERKAVSTDDQPSFLAVVLAIAVVIYLLSWSIAGSPFDDTTHEKSSKISRLERVTYGYLF